MSEHRDERCTEVPDNWPTVPAEVHDVAKERALQTLVEAGERGAAERLAAFYDTESVSYTHLTLPTNREV